MKNIHEVKQELDEVLKQLKRVDNLQDNFIYDGEDPEETFLARKINECLELAGDLEGKIKGLSKEIDTEGRLVTNTNGRYEVNGFELTSGATLEYWDTHYQEWSEDRIEHFNGAYGLYYKKSNDLDGLYVRIRKKS